MNINRQTVIAAVVALTLAGGLFLFFVLLRKPAAEEAVSAAGTPGEAPQDPVHERAAMLEELRKNPGHAPILFRLAELERGEGNFDSAAGYIRQILQSDSANKDAYVELGRVLYEGGDVDGAIASTQELIELDPANVDGLYNLGAIYANQGRFDLARDYWQKAVASDPGSESGKRASSAITQLEAPQPAPAATALPPGHPVTGDVMKLFRSRQE